MMLQQGFADVTRVDAREMVVLNSRKCRGFAGVIN